MNEERTSIYKALLLKNWELSREEVPCELLKEHELRILVNGQLYEEMVCTREYLPELVTGRLYCEGVIESVEDIQSLMFSPDETTVMVDVQKNQEEAHPQSMQKFTWKSEWLEELAYAFEKDLPLHTRTSATHSCFLMIEGTVLFSCEDIGRHNAMDKVIGYALLKGYDLNSTILLTSGRVPKDRAEKAIRAGIPVLISKKEPTLQAVELAKEKGLTLIGHLKKGSAFLYTP